MVSRPACGALRPRRGIGPELETHPPPLECSGAGEFLFMRAVVTGQVGVDKGPYLEAVKAEARKNGHDLEVCHVGRMMYAEAPDVPAGRILNLPITRLNTLRRAVFKEILRTA